MKTGFILLSLLWAFKGYGINNLYISETNPASLSGELQIACDKAFEKLQKDFLKYAKFVPMVSQVSKLGETPWKETSSSTESKVEGREMFMTLESTRTEEFPMTLVPFTLSRTICKPKEPGSTNSCTNTYSVKLEGKQAHIYQKAVEMGAHQNYLASFTMSFTFTDTGTADKCTYYNSLSVENNTYLWLKRHLVGSTQPDVVQTQLLKAYTQWAKLVAKALEVKQ